MVEQVSVYPLSTTKGDEVKYYSVDIKEKSWEFIYTDTLMSKNGEH